MVLYILIFMFLNSKLEDGRFWTEQYQAWGHGRIQAQADQAAAQGGRFVGAASKLSNLLITTTPFHSLTERYSMNVDGNFN